MLEDQLAQGRGRWSDLAHVGADALDRPTRVSSVAGRHVFGNGGVLAVAAVAQMRGDPFALEENLNRPCR
jgi:hypothetical protein